MGAMASIWAASLVAVSGGPADPGAVIAYEVGPVIGPRGLDGVDVTLSFQGDRDGRTEIRLPTRWAGTERLEQTVGEVRVDGARWQRRRSSLRLRHAPGAPLRLTYRIRQDYPGPTRVGFDRPYRPSTPDDGFTLIGWTILARVVGREREPVSFHWGPAPATWRRASDLDRLEGGAADFDTLADSVLVGGTDLTLVQRDTAAGPLILAVQGHWRFSPQELADRVVAIGQATADFWGDQGQPSFLALMPLAGPQTARAQTGLGLGDGVAIWLTPNQGLDEASHVLLHEQLHAWLPARVGGLANDGSEVLDFWFSEGFTEFFTYRIALRLGLETPEAYIAALDEALAAQAGSPPGLANTAVARRFFRDPAITSVPYYRGLLLALHLDERLRRQSNGRINLDEVLMRMRSGRGLAPRRLIQAYGDLGGGDITPLLHRHIDLGRPIWLSPGDLGDCVRIVDGPDRQHLQPGLGLAGPDREACRDRLAGL